MTRKWDHRKWGKLDDPVHKSQTSTIVGDYACTLRFKFDRDREVAGGDREVVSGSAALGTAAHEVIARVLRSPAARERLWAGQGLDEAAIRKALVEEYHRAVGDLPVAWYGKSEYDKASDDRVEMLEGLFRDIARHVGAVELVEAGFITQVGEIWVEGHIDLVYRTPDGELALTDWKTGKSKPCQIELDHGFESGFYSAALKNGVFLEGQTVAAWQRAARADALQHVPLDPWDAHAIVHAADDRAAMHAALRGTARRMERGESLPEGVVRFDEFPSVVRLTHLPDYQPYQRAGKKSVDRPEEMEHWHLTEPGEVKYQAGQQKGPAWYRIRRTPDDIARLETMLRGIVGWVRMGKFVAAIGEKCARCSHRTACLTSGYEQRGEVAKELNAALRGLDDGLDGLD